MDWQPIETATTDLWNSPLVRVRYADGRELIASYGWEDEIWTGEDEILIGCWHEDGDLMKPIDEPDEWRPLE